MPSRHRFDGYHLQKLQQMETSNGTAYSVRIMHNKKLVAQAEDRGDGGAVWFYYDSREAEAAFMEVVRRRVGTEPEADAVFLEQLIEAHQNDKFSRKSTIVQSDPDVDDTLKGPITYQLKGLFTPEQVAQSAHSFSPPLRRIWKIGEGFVDLPPN